MIGQLKNVPAGCDIYLCGRFAEWGYFNIDAAIASAMTTVNGIVHWIGRDGVLW